jgi:hypothetical protein
MTNREPIKFIGVKWSFSFFQIRLACIPGRSARIKPTLPEQQSPEDWNPQSHSLVGFQRISGLFRILPPPAEIQQKPGVFTVLFL